MVLLSDLSILNPPDTEAVSQGASRIRTLTDAAKTTMDVEHHQSGEHQFPVAEPGSPKLGQVWLDQTNKRLEYYNGSAWVHNVVGQMQRSYLTTPLVIPTITETSIGSVAMNFRSLAPLIMWFSWTIELNPAFGSEVTTSFYYNSVLLGPQFYHEVALTGPARTYFGLTAQLFSTSATLEAKIYATQGFTINQRQVIGVVL